MPGCRVVSVFFVPAAVAMIFVVPFRVASCAEPAFVTVDSFDRPDMLYHGDGWESLNPGYWKIENGALRRRLHNVGDRARATGYPFHWETMAKRPMPVEYDPSLPFGMIWRRDWKLAGNYTIRIDATIRALPQVAGDPSWRQNQPGYAMMGIAFGGQSLHESWHGLDRRIDYGPRLWTEFDQWKAEARHGDAAWMAAWRSDGHFGIYDHATDLPEVAQVGSEQRGPLPKPGDRVQIELAVSTSLGVRGSDPSLATVTATLTAGTSVTTVTFDDVDRAKFTDGYFGLVARGLLDFEVNRVALDSWARGRLHAPVNECHTCYALGETLREVDGRWQCKFVAVFRAPGRCAEIRIADSADPPGGWAHVPVAGWAEIKSNDFRLNTAIVTAALPTSPAEKTLYYTVWKDGRDVTGDPRIGTDSVGPGTGMTGEPATDGNYVGRLPRLTAPYRICGLGGHMIDGPQRTTLQQAEPYEENWLHDQPMPEACRHVEEFDFQVMLWEDDVWYLVVVIFPPSTDDAYKTIMATIAGPTGRWQMMRHWNVINPGDHDLGMDDSKGPEQLIVRNREGLGQDPAYMRRNLQIVHHLVQAQKNPTATDNPKRWTRWKMPRGDFSLLVLDARLWRTSQDTNLWAGQGWGQQENLLDRKNPTRTLLGEEQFAWLTEIIRTDSSPLICLTGLNGLHTLWGRDFDANQRNRGLADYAGWVKAGTDRVLELLGSRPGVTTVFGDIHLASVVYSLTERVYECSLGPITSVGSRGVKPGFGPETTDCDGRPVRVLALYHGSYESPDLKRQTSPKHWNFLEMVFDPRGADPTMRFAIHNLVDSPADPVRGGGAVEDRASNTGRLSSCRLPAIKTLPSADVLFTSETGRPLRGARSLPDGTVPVAGLIDVEPGRRVVVTAFDGKRTEAMVLTTLPAER
jgi:hypothetical protein